MKMEKGTKNCPKLSIIIIPPQPAWPWWLISGPSQLTLIHSSWGGFQEIRIGSIDFIVVSCEGGWASAILSKLIF